MRIAIVGATGQLGSDLTDLLGDKAVPLGHDSLELKDPAGFERTLDAAEPDCVINAAAYNQVDRAEDEPQQAFAVNAFGVRHLSRDRSRADVPLLHVSTDYVFGLEADRNVPYTERDAPGPLSVYGASKLSGEYFVRSLCRRHFVVRTCGLYGVAALSGHGKGNFVETMLRLGGERNELRVVDDQWCTPTSTANLARAIAALVATDAYGLYHVTNSGEPTWCSFAREIFRTTDADVRVLPIDSSEFPAKAQRPAYSLLDTQKISETLGFELPHWKDALREYLTERKVISGDR